MDAVLAKYGDGGEKRILLLVRYPDLEKARSGLREFLGSYLPEGSEGTPVKLEDGTWSGCRLDGPLLAVVFKASEASQVSGLLNAVGRPDLESKEQPDQKRGTP